VAIALSKGGALKTYEHTDPNEDAAAFAIGPAGIVAAVADGHNGAEGAELALGHLLDHWASHWTGEDCALQDEAAWQTSLRQAFLEANTEILRNAAERGVPPPGTTLSVAIVRPGEDRLVHAVMGDSPLYEVTIEGAILELGFQVHHDVRRRFLGHQTETSESMRGSCAVGSRPLRDVRAVVLASDGLTEVGIGLPDAPTAVAEIVARSAEAAPDLRPLETARCVVEAALAAHRGNRAGDNAASAVVWLDRTPH